MQPRKIAFQDARPAAPDETTARLDRRTLIKVGATGSARQSSQVVYQGIGGQRGEPDVLVTGEGRIQLDLQSHRRQEMLDHVWQFLRSAPSCLTLQISKAEPRTEGKYDRAVRLARIAAHAVASTNMLGDDVENLHLAHYHVEVDICLALIRLDPRFLSTQRCGLSPGSLFQDCR